MKLIEKFQEGKKFSNTPTGRAMQRQYDLEHGITIQKVLPEVEVFPNYYNIDDNGYSNSFAIPLEHRPTTFSQGEISQPYVPKKLDEQGWLNRTFGINNFGLGIMELIGNPANVVPTGKTIQGIKALTSNKAKNAGKAVQKVKRVYSMPKVDVMPVEGSITTSDVPAITAENAASITPAQWDAAYNKAIVSNNNAEVQRLRDLHFYAKTGETPIIQYRGSSNPTLRNTYYRNDGSAVWFTPDEDAASFYTPPGTNRPPRAHYIKTKDGKILHVDGATKNFDGSTIPSNWSAIPVENIPENISKHFPEEEINFGKIRFKSKPSYVNTGDIVHAAKLEGYNQVDFQNIIDAKAKSSGVYPQFTTRYYNNIKLADPITYDDAGNIIPLSKRDNFNSSDIRYGILPWIFGGTIGYNYLNQDETSSKYTNGGKLTKHKL